MQWSKAKTYMIIALIFANVVLFFGLSSKKVYFNDEISHKSIENLDKLLNRMDVKNEVKLNSNKTKIHPLVLEFVGDGDEEFDEIFVNIKSKYNNVIRVIDGIYVELSLDEKDLQMSEDKKEFAGKFLKEAFPMDEYRLKDFAVDEGTETLLFEQYLGDFFVGQGYVKFVFSDDDFKYVDISILKGKINVQKSKDTYAISNAQAISMAIPQLTKGDVISDISFGYDVAKNSSYENDESLAREIRMMPYWRIRLDSGEYIFIEAIK